MGLASPTLTTHKAEQPIVLYQHQLVGQILTSSGFSSLIQKDSITLIMSTDPVASCVIGY